MVLAPPPQTNAEEQPEMDTERAETAPDPPQTFDDCATVNVEDLEQDDVVVAVMGPTGSGKSTFVCRARGHNDASGVSHGLSSFTSDILAFRFKDHGSGRHVVLVDTPSFNSTSKSDFDVLNIISEWLNKSYKNEKLLSAILYLHRITDNRMAGTPLRNLQLFQKLCGKDALNKVYLITTMWDEVDANVGKERLTELTQKFWKAMVNQGAQMARCRSDDDSARKLIQQIVGQDNVRKAILLQKEMAGLMKELTETEAEQECHSQLEKLVEKQLALLRRIDAERKNAPDPCVLEELQTEYDELGVQINKRLSQMQGLKLSRFRWRPKGNSTVSAPPPSRKPQGGLPSDDYVTVNIGDLDADDVVIAVMGPTGSGKSTFIRRASGLDVGVGDGLNSFTSEVLPFKFRDQESGRHVVLIDTPSFDTSKSDLVILNMIAGWLKSSYMKEKLLSGILYLHRITDNRMTGTPLKNLNMFQKLCSKDALDKVYLATTMWDDVEPSVGENRLTELRQVYWKVMVNQGAQIARCRSDDDSARKLMQRIVAQDSVRKVILLRNEIVNLKKDLEEAGAEQELYSQLSTLVEKQLVLLQRIDEERKKASDSSALEGLQREYKELHEEIDGRLRQMRKVKLSRLRALLRFFWKRD